MSVNIFYVHNLFPGIQAKILEEKNILTVVLIFYIKKTKSYGKFCKYIVHLAVLLASSYKFQSDREDFAHNSR